MKYFLAMLCSIFLLANCFDGKTNKAQVEDKGDRDYVTEGNEIASATFATLSGNLQNAMKAGGVSEAVKYCNFAASPLVDSLEQVYNVDIKRTALKIRSQKNKPTQLENRILQNYQKQFEEGQKSGPIIQEYSDVFSYHAPIPMMPLCEKCHGMIGESIAEEDYAVIQKLYPDDKAVNFMAGDLRGMWSITFKD